MIAWFECTGIYRFWRLKNFELVAKEGKEAAKKSYVENKIYDGEETGDDDAETYTKILLYLEVLGLGYSVSLLLFLSEHVSAVYRHWRFAFSR